MKLQVLYTILLAGALSASAAEIKSPSGEFLLKVDTDAAGVPVYSLSYKGKTIVRESRLGLTADEIGFDKGFSITDAETASVDQTWNPVWGEYAEIRDRYNELAVNLRGGSPERVMTLRFRLSDDGLGFRYELPRQENANYLTLRDEMTEFNFTDDHTMWCIPGDYDTDEYLWSETTFSHLPEALGNYGRHTEARRTGGTIIQTPMLIKTADPVYVSVHEAALVGYPAMLLDVDTADRLMRTHLVPDRLGVKAYLQLPFNTPWRTLIVSDDARDIIASQMILNLNEPCRIEDTSWCKPGRYIGIWWGMHMKDWTWEQGPKHGATTENTKRYIDFAAANGYDGVLVEGWNLGWDGDWNVNGDKFSFTESYPDFDLKEVTDYARRKGVRLIGHHETGGAAQNYEKQMEDAFSLYEKLGVNCVKTGYVNPLLDGKELHGSQYGVRHYRKVIENAAKHHIVIDNHEPVMPTGLQRTYPNLMTQEGMRGQEYDAFSRDGGNPPEHTCVLPFTRGLAGPMDFTPGTFNFTNKAVPGTRPNTTIAKQLALAVVIYSPLVMSSDQIQNYENRPEFEFLRTCPPNWDKTLVPEAKIGEYVTIVRKDRDSDNWYVGTITNSNSHDTEIDCSFLPKDKKFKAKIFADGKGADWKENPYPVEISEIEVDSTSKIPLHLANGGGAAIAIRKI